jgi:hypothetical protein
MTNSDKIFFSTLAIIGLYVIISAIFKFPLLKYSEFWWIILIPIAFFKHVTKSKFTKWLNK